MIDIEGLADTPDGVVVAVGAVQFDLVEEPHILICPLDGVVDGIGTVKPTYHANINMHSSVRAGLRLGPDAVAWWLGGDSDSPDDSARHSLFTPKPIPLPEALAGLREFCKGAEGVWANPVSYDLVTLAQSYRAARQQLAWRWKKTFDVRSYLKGVPHDRVKVSRYGVRHHPVWDACNQATWVVRAHAYKEQKKGAQSG